MAGEVGHAERGDSSYLSHHPDLGVWGTEVAFFVDPPPFFPCETAWQRLRAQTVRSTSTEKLKYHEVVATFVVANQTIAMHRHPRSLRQRRSSGGAIVAQTRGRRRWARILSVVEDDNADE